MTLQLPFKIDPFQTEEPTKNINIFEPLPVGYMDKGRL